jgi:hypothetical protein
VDKARRWRGKLILPDAAVLLDNENEPFFVKWVSGESGGRTVSIGGSKDGKNQV